MGDQSWKICGSELVHVGADGAESVLSASDIYSALVERRPPWDGIPLEVPGMRASRYPLLPAIIIAESGEGIPEYRLTGSCRGQEVPLILDDLLRGHVVSSGVWYPIDPDQGNALQHLLEESGARAGPATSLHVFLRLKNEAANGGPVDDRLVNRSVSPLVFTPPAQEAPKGVHATLYDYQMTGWRWLKFLLAEGIGGILADEMGLGKTLEVIAVLSDSRRGELAPTLIIAPGSILENWRRELGRFAPGLNVLKHHGSLRTGHPDDLNSFDVVITSYESAVRDTSLLNMVPWKVIILDEAQYIRNPDTQRTRAVKHLRREAGLAVTGTPVENRLLDLWSIMDFVLPGYLGDRAAFERTYTEDISGAERLEPLISPLMLRRRIADVASDLPPRIDIPQVIDLQDVEAAAYDAIREEIAAQYGASATLVALLRLRQYCAHPALVEKKHAPDPMSFGKFRRLHDILKEIFTMNEKVIIFTSFTDMADMIVSHVRDQLLAFADTIDGRLAIDERQLLIDKFSKISGAAALVLNPKAGGTGLNITAANHVIHYNLEWNPAVEDQASARVYRRGQEQPVTVHRLFVADTVEDVVNDRLNRKRNVSGAVVVGIEGRDEDYADIVAALARSPLRRAAGDNG